MRKEIDPKRIGLVGHSEGGLIAPLAASRSKNVAFIVLMAGTGVTGEEILYRQGELIARAAGASDEQVAQTREVQEKTFAILKEEKDDAEAEKRLRELMADAVAKSGAAVPAEVIQKQVDAQVKAALSPWFRAFLQYDPRQALTKVKCPVLAINGEKDLQVDPKQNLPEIEKALVSGGNKDHTLRELPGLNHLFQACKTGAVSEYGSIEETFSPAALEIIGDWIVEHTR
jgi:pimeloyl-ACP methyl ester carboxylesterase